MSAYFSSLDIFTMALQIEQKGHSFYEAMVNHAQNKNLKDGFQWLANEEKLHINNFEQLRESIERINTKNIDNWEEVSLYFKALLDTKVFPLTPNGNSLAQELKDEIGAIQISISFEKDTILFLQELSRWVNPEDQKKIEKLIEQEKGHVLKLIEMRKQVL
jgi:rubrerythrin